ncbi:hypothetical protein [Arachnia propionica]|uniref:hypothetical protein n=1 Tax=Arachnia propionica TaxID=1750 RepID=UPI0028E889D4|nr:hypothetical protein [Arachnia propionica]
MRRVLTVLLACLALFGPPPPVARADDPAPLPQPSTAGSNAVGACLAAGQVWVVVVDETDQVHANQCVGTPSSGEQALADAGMRLEFGRSRLICTIDAHPASCPSRFTGQYWHYYHALPGQGWTYSQQGAGSRKPPPGSIEGWCYNASDQESCFPPELLITRGGEVIAPPGVAQTNLLDPPVVVKAPASLPIEIPWGLIAAGVVLAALVAVAWWLRRRRPAPGRSTDPDETELGGR